MIKRTLLFIFVFLLLTRISQATPPWEKEGNSYYLTKDSRESFSAPGAGENKFPEKYATYDSVDFLVRGTNNWQDYGRLNLEGNNIFSLPLEPGTKIEEVHLLAGGNFGNSYKHDPLLRLYGDNYYYGLLTVIFIYADATTQARSVPIFWDWFHLSKIEWSQDQAKIRYVGDNPVRRGCTIYHATFTNPKPQIPVKNVLIADSWISDLPFSDVFAVTIKASAGLKALPKENKKFMRMPTLADGQPATKRTEWSFVKDTDGWVTGASDNWSVEATWKDEAFNKKGVIIIPGCRWGGDKFSWIENKIALPEWNQITLQFTRHSAVYSPLNKTWTDGLLKVIIRDPEGAQNLYEKIYSGEWITESIDLTPYKTKTVIIRFENHGGGRVKLDSTNAPACDGEDAIIGNIQLKD